MKYCRRMLIVAVLSLGCSVVYLGRRMPWLVVCGVGIAIWHAKRNKRLTDLGSARWADELDLRGMIEARKGINIGRLTVGTRKLLPAIGALFNSWLDDESACKAFLGWFKKPDDSIVRINPVHMAVFAPTGVGKGVSFVIPYLLECEDSCVVMDFKGELAKITAEHRRQMGHDVRIIDPYRVVTQTPDVFNPVDPIRKDSQIAIDECRDAAAELVVKTHHEKELHWPESAETWIATMLAAVAWFGEPGNRSLQTVRTLLSNPEKMQAIIRLICRTPDAWDGMLARMGQQLTRYQGDELGSTLTTTNRFLKFLDTIAIAESTGKQSTFDPSDLTRKKMTIYLVLPPEHVRAQQGLLRLWIGSMLRAVVKNGLQEKNLVHFVLDEAATLGPMDALTDALDKYRGYGVRCQFYYQSVGQLKKCWPDGQDQTLLANCSTIWFGVNDNESARYVSDRLGDATITLESGSDGRSTSYQRQHTGQSSSGESYQNTDSWQPKERRLLKPEEVTGLSPRVAITFTPGVRPIWTTLTRYYEEKSKTAADGLKEKASIIARCVGVLVYALAISACVLMFANQKVRYVRIHGHHHVSR